MHQYPHLIHPVPVELRKLNRAATRWDDKAREPVGRAVRNAAVVLQAQVLYNAVDKPTADFLGPQHECKGYVLFLQRDLEAAGVVVERGDKITKIANRVVDYFVLYFEDAGHYQEFGSTLLKAFFVDRDPGESTG